MNLVLLQNINNQKFFGIEFEDWAMHEKLQEVEIKDQAKDKFYAVLSNINPDDLMELKLVDVLCSLDEYNELETYNTERFTVITIDGIDWLVDNPIDTVDVRIAAATPGEQNKIRVIGLTYDEILNKPSIIALYTKQAKYIRANGRFAKILNYTDDNKVTICNLGLDEVVNSKDIEIIALVRHSDFLAMDDKTLIIRDDFAFLDNKKIANINILLRVMRVEGKLIDLDKSVVKILTDIIMNSNIDRNIRNVICDDYFI